jgi:hypothetical protein
VGLKNIFSKIFKHFVYDDINSILGSVKTYYELYLALQGKNQIIRNAPQIVDFTVGDLGTPVHSTSIIAKQIENFGDWRKAVFSGLTITDSQSGGYRFKQVNQLTMMSSLAERMYFTNKYPLNLDYRYRLIKDILQKAETKKVIILNGWHYGNLFQASDKDLFVDVQALPKLTQAEWAEFKQVTQSTATGLRVTKEEVSFVILNTNYEYADLQQKTVDEVIDFSSRMQVMWVGSNRRYEFPFGNCIYKLKIKGDCKNIRQNLEFYFDSAKNMIPNWTEGDSIRFGIVILPEGHPLRSLLPELVEDLRSVALFAAREFLKTPHFQVEKSYSDVFIKLLKENILVFDKLLEGWQHREPFDKWIANGMPNGERKIHKPRIPFFLWDDSDIEMKDVKRLYNEEQNCISIDVREFYSWISKKFLLFRHNYSWSGIDSESVASEMIEYMKFKLGIKSNGN